MPLKENLKKVMVIGSGPIIIGQAAEFDYAGTQACRALREAGLQVVLVNSNPATIMTDNDMADKIYIESLSIETVKRIIEKERPDGLLSTLGGQTGLTLSMQLAKEGFLDKMGVELLGANPETIDKAEDRLLFKETMEKIGKPCVPSIIVNDVESAVEFAKTIGYPLILRPAFTLGGTGGGIVENEAEMREICENGLRLSPITQVLVEKCIAGWKEIEFEVMRDSTGKVITICSMENFDPVGIHTGDSIVAAPALTLSDAEYGLLKNAALDIISELKIEGGCNCQFALRPDGKEYAVIEVNPRVSRSSALASKATGYPIAKVAAKIAIGFTLDEIKNGKTAASHEPVPDYIVCKFPKWPFEKFVYAKRKLGTQMKATGEVMSIGATFEEALMKAVRGVELKLDTLTLPEAVAMSDEALMAEIHECTDRRIFLLYEALGRGVSIDVLYEITKIDKFFLGKLANLLEFEKRLSREELTDELYLEGKRLGFLDGSIEKISGQKIKKPALVSYKMVKACSCGKIPDAPYFYSSFDGGKNEALEFIQSKGSGKKKIIVFGSGPIRIGQGIEFDYASVHCVWSLKKLGYEVIIVNNNPETVSTDFDTADRLYFEPLCFEDVMGVIATEKPYGVVVAFGGQTAIKLTNALDRAGVKILGTSADSIDAAEDRERFDALLESLKIKRPEGFTVFTEAEALSVAQRIGYPVLIRPSYVLGGQNMIIAFCEDDIREYMKFVLANAGNSNPILIDKYLMGTELEVDAICDGEDILIPGVMEHIERTGIHSGDSIAVYPAWNVSDEMLERIVECSRLLSLGLHTVGLVNIQYLVHEGELYVIEVNPRSSRTIPYISKVTGVPMVDIATSVMVGEEKNPECPRKLKNLEYGVGLYRNSPYFAVKVPVFSFEKLAGVDTQLGPEMKSTGEVLGIADTMQEALCKGLLAAGYNMSHKGSVLISVRENDREEIADVARKFSKIGFTVYACENTAKALTAQEVPVITIPELSSPEEAFSLIESGNVSYIISISSRGRIPTRNSVKLRRKAIERSIPCLTSIDTANALAMSIMSKYSAISTELVNINDMREEKLSLSFTKMSDCGNDYIYFDARSQKIDNPAGLSVRLSDRHGGVGADGVVLIEYSTVADAKMRIFNKDGSEGGMAGNAIRCVGKYLYDNGIVSEKDISIETRSGIKELSISTRNGKALSVTAKMGKFELSPKKIPVKLSGDSVISRNVTLGGDEYKITCVSMGNPHCIIFYPKDISLDKLDVETIGARLEGCEIFPERANIEFVKVLSDRCLKVRVWERGNGATLACGTGACAAAVAAILDGKCRFGENITVKLPGGDLGVLVQENAEVTLTGQCETIFEGKITL